MLEYFRDRKKNKRFDSICASAKLSLDFQCNKSALPVLQDIFIDREYADYFPFYEQVTVVDIGAHFGYFSIFASRNTDSSSTIFSLEPSAHNFKILNQNLKDCNIRNVKTFPLAIGNEIGDFELYEGDSVNHSLFQNYTLSLQQQRSTTVKVLDLDTFIKENNINSIDFLKMDCEGAEYSIIFNAPRKVMDKIQVISMEFHDMHVSNKTPNQLREKLISEGFKVVKFEYKRTTMNLNYGKLVAIK